VDQSRTFQWRVVVEAAGVGTGGVGDGVSTVQSSPSVSELTTRPLFRCFKEAEAIGIDMDGFVSQLEAM